MNDLNSQPLRLYLLEDPEGARFGTSTQSWDGLRQGLLGWGVDAPWPVDDTGIPQAAAQVLCAALCRLGLVSMPMDDDKAVYRVNRCDDVVWTAVDKGWTAELCPGLWGLLRRWACIPILCTADPDLATERLCAAEHNWVLQHQTIIVSIAQDHPPRWNCRHARSIVLQERLDASIGFNDSGILGVIVPTHDGSDADLRFAHAVWP